MVCVDLLKVFIAIAQGKHKSGLCRQVPFSTCFNEKPFSRETKIRVFVDWLKVGNM